MNREAIVTQRTHETWLDAVLEPLLASPDAKTLRSLRIDVLAFTKSDGDYQTTKPVVHRALTELGAMLANADLPALETLVVGPLFADAMPTKPAAAPLRLAKAPRLRPREDGFLEVYTEAWLSIREATPAAESLGHTKGKKIPLGVGARVNLEGHVIVPAGTSHDESPEELRGRPWKITHNPDIRATYAAVHWGPGWRILEVGTVNGEPIDPKIRDKRNINLVPGDVVTTRFGELTLELFAR